MTKLERELIAATMAWWRATKKSMEHTRWIAICQTHRDACAAYAKAQKKKVKK